VLTDGQKSPEDARLPVPELSPQPTLRPPAVVADRREVRQQSPVEQIRALDELGDAVEEHALTIPKGNEKGTMGRGLRSWDQSEGAKWPLDGGLVERDGKALALRAMDCCHVSLGSCALKRM
jgi:hypothetical protein